MNYWSERIWAGFWGVVAIMATVATFTVGGIWNPIFMVIALSLFGEHLDKIRKTRKNSVK